VYVCVISFVFVFVFVCLSLIVGDYAGTLFLATSPRCVYLCVCVCMCVREREGEKLRREREISERERKRECMWVGFSVCVYACAYVC